MSVGVRWTRSGQAVDSGRAVLVLAVGLLVVAAVAEAAAHGLTQPRIALAFGVLVALGELARMNLPGNRESAPIGSAGGLAYALLMRVGATPAPHGTLQVVAVVAVGVVVGALPHAVLGRSPRFDGMARRVLVVALVAATFRPIARMLPPVDQHGWVVLCTLVTLVVLAGFVDAAVAAVVQAGSLCGRFGTALRDELRALAPLAGAVGASGLLIALAAHAMGLTALLVFVAPLLVTQFAYRRYAGIRATYLQTIRALSRVTEVGGYVETGHSRRVSRLAVSVGRELCMSEPELLELEYAALMHDIGQLSLRDPIPGGATVLASVSEQRQIAELGAEVIRQTGVLDRVAEIVRRQTDPYRPEIGIEDATLPLASRIIKVTNAYDDLVGGSTDRDRQTAVLERLRLGIARDYDPKVVEALSRIVERSLASAPS